MLRHATQEQKWTTHGGRIPQCACGARSWGEHTRPRVSFPTPSSETSPHPHRTQFSTKIRHTPPIPPRLRRGNQTRVLPISERLDKRFTCTEPPCARNSNPSSPATTTTTAAISNTSKPASTAWTSSSLPPDAQRPHPLSTLATPTNRSTTPWSTRMAKNASRNDSAADDRRNDGPHHLLARLGS
jgi:hypothetical protein